MHDDEQEFYDFLVEHGIATEEELDLVTNCFGFTIDTFERVLYYREGYETREQYLGLEDEEDVCEGHESLDGAHMGMSVYCDGSCV